MMGKKRRKQINHSITAIGKRVPKRLSRKALGVTTAFHGLR